MLISIVMLGMWVICVMCVVDVWCVMCVFGVCVWCVLGACGLCWVCVVCVVQNWAFTLIKFLASSLWARVQSFFCVRAIIKHTQFHVAASLVQMADLKLEHHRADICKPKSLSSVSTIDQSI